MLGVHEAASLNTAIISKLKKGYVSYLKTLADDTEMEPKKAQVRMLTPPSLPPLRINNLIAQRARHW